MAIAGIGRWSLAPIALGVATSLSTQADVQAVPARWLPRHAMLDAYRSLLGGTARRYFGIFGNRFLWGCVIAGSVFIVTIPVVIWVLVRWAVSLPALFAEGAGPVQALGRSWNLTKDNWWRCLGVLIVISFMVGLIQGALVLLFTGIAALMPGLSDDLRAGLVTTVATLVNALVGAITPIAITMLYLDLRVRKEGLDLDQLARQAVPGPAPA